MRGWGNSAHQLQVDEQQWWKRTPARGPEDLTLLVGGQACPHASFTSRDLQVALLGAPLSSLQVRAAARAASAATEGRGHSTAEPSPAEQEDRWDRVLEAYPGRSPSPHFLLFFNELSSSPPITKMLVDEYIQIKGTCTDYSVKSPSRRLLNRE